MDIKNLSKIGIVRGKKLQNTVGKKKKVNKKKVIDIEIMLIAKKIK